MIGVIGVDPGVRFAGVVGIVAGSAGAPRVVFQELVKCLDTDEPDRSRFQVVGDAVRRAHAVIVCFYGPLTARYCGCEDQFLAAPKSARLGSGDYAEAVRKMHDAARLMRVSERVSAICDEVLHIPCYAVAPMDVKRSFGVSGKTLGDPKAGCIRMAQVMYPELVLPTLSRGPNKGEVKADDASHLVDALGVALHVASRVQSPVGEEDLQRQQAKGRKKRSTLGNNGLLAA